ncbi:MAG: hypothetical protein RLZZ488_2739 [Pseudomonadota bacterium]|jgi:folate-dependent phosphoribosylglycinamide formyltransferase PurN
MIVALCSGQGRTFEAVARILGAQLSDMICDVPAAAVVGRAQSLGVRTHCVARSEFPDRGAHESAVLEALENCTPFSIVALLGYMRILSPNFLVAIKKNWPHSTIINLHPAPMSLYKGSKGLQHALDRRFPHWGLSVHKVTDELDAGPLLAFRNLEIFPTDTFEILRERAHPLEVSAVLEAIDILTRRSLQP